MILISNTNNKFIYADNNKSIIYKLNRTSETINKLIQYDLNKVNVSIFNIIDIEFIFLLIDINEIELLKKIKINQCDFGILKVYTYNGLNKKYNNMNLYAIFEQLYSYYEPNVSALIFNLIGSSHDIIHRENDLPAIIYNNGTKYWYKNGLKRRDNDLPSVICSNGHKEWYKNNMRHRDNDLLAIISSNGTKEWHKNGRYHRDNDLPSIITCISDKYWFKNGLLHRDNDLSAIINSDGTKH
jgi:hypothetical protein